MKPNRIEEAKTYYNLHKTGVKYPDVARKYGKTRGYVVGLVDQLIKAKLTEPLPFQVSLGEPLKLSGDFINVGDVHVPFTDYNFSQMVIKVAKKYNIKKMNVGGDFFNFDNFSVYAHAIPTVQWAQEREAARLLIHEWLEWFDEINFIMGNHDRRLAKWTEGQFDEKDLFGMVTTSDKCHFSNWGWCDVTSGGVDWLVAHGSNYSVNQLTVASELANKHQKNVILSHEHHAGMGWDKYKRYVVVNNGGLFDASKFAYVNLDVNKMPNMQNAFTMLRNGVATLFSKWPFTDWSDIV
jgi:hypothetical protein